MMQSQIPPVALIDIGLPKTATSYLQTLWARDRQVCMIQNGLLPLITDARAQEQGHTPPARIQTS